MNNAIELNRYAYNEVKRKEMRNTLQLNGKNSIWTCGKHVCTEKSFVFVRYF